MLKTSALLTCLFICAVQAQEQGVPANAPHIVTTGSAEIRVPADMATLDFSISLLEKRPSRPGRRWMPGGGVY